jgi:hypothetical protein
MEVLIPLLAIGSPLIFVWIVLRYKTQRDQLQQDTLLKLVAAGHPVPQHFLTPPKRSATADLRTGLSLIGLGLGLLCVLMQLNGPWSISLIPSFVGLAFLITWALSRSEERSTMKNLDAGPQAEPVQLK